MSRLASYHYKSEVLNEINKLVAKGIELENIFILSESFKYDFTYSFLKDIQIEEKSIYSLLNIGLPITLQPNEKILKLKYGYQILNYLYDNSTIAREFGFRREWFWNNYLEFVTNSFEKTTNKFLEHSIITKSKKKRESMIKYIKEKKLAFNTDSFFFQKNIKKENKNQTEIAKFFLKKINIIQRPVFGNFIPSTQTFKILNVDLIKKVKKGNIQFDLKSLSHNSPWELIIEGAGELFKYFLDGEKRKLENELMKSQISNAKKDEMLKNLEIIKESQKTLEAINSSSNGLPNQYKNTMRELVYIQLDQLSQDIKQRAYLINHNTPIIVQSAGRVDLLA
ncbi:hypothetical protein LEP1GSC203_0421 [Leptospira terpstrae serovar Hualin str. LT 11-33 = ATCC 700639]|uniref:Uncharacterized protein n=1 Tax=Leptospira terpstrae serovar Hualin str. LT 11-33 = ATCC 700639 TaxID=1257025 RepID=N1W2P9_9LEPT|nr:hypothetical protein LEP1GSC203_0421 [Leptospira terpstrae serovar Hualin str. LT 11-33 = ATCC 700639]